MTEKGRFRTFLLVALKRFLANEWDRAQAQKRGGSHTHLPLDTDLAERRYQNEPAAELPADRIYERRWALTLLDQTMTRLRLEFERAGKGAEFERLKLYLTAEKGALAGPEVAASLGLSEGALRVARHRLRKRFREVFREEIAHTVSSPEGSKRKCGICWRCSGMSGCNVKWMNGWMVKWMKSLNR